MANELLPLVREVVAAMGYEFDASDEALLSHCVMLAIERVLSDICSDTLPESLCDAVASIAAGEFLLRALCRGGASLKSISEGDVSLSYEDTRAAQAQRMIDSQRAAIAAHRRLRWE